MIVALDIGNSAVKGGVFDGETHAPGLRAVIRSADEAADFLRSLGGDDTDTRIGMCSVVPSVAALFETACRILGVPQPLTVSSASPLPFRLGYASPGTLGSDRIAAVVGGWYSTARDGRPLIVVDAGTATTIEVVDRTGVYLGGPILAGPTILRDGLARGTAQLPNVVLTVPPSAIGRDTSHALQSGVMFGFVDGVRGLVQRILDETGHDAHVLATGGWGALLTEHIGEIGSYNPDTVLEGVARVVEASERD